jgi:hypothetical protein
LKVTNLEITPEPTEEERRAIEAALAASERQVPPPSWDEESEQFAP